MCSLWRPSPPFYIVNTNKSIFRETTSSLTFTDLVSPNPRSINPWSGKFVTALSFKPNPMREIKQYCKNDSIPSSPTKNLVYPKYSLVIIVFLLRPICKKSHKFCGSTLYLVVLMEQTYSLLINDLKVLPVFCP